MSSHHPLPSAVLSAVLLAFAIGPTHAAGGGGDEAGPSSAEMTKAVAAIKAGRYPDAIALLRSEVARSSNNADAFNWLGYAYRKSGQLEPAFTAYKRALSIDPQHKGAHEYIGEAYLQAGQPAKAEEHLRALDKLCPQGCEERDDLKKAIAAYKPGAATAAR